MQSMTINSAAIRLTGTILGNDEPDLEQALNAIAANIGVSPRMPRSRRAGSRPGFKVHCAGPTCSAKKPWLM